MKYKVGDICVVHGLENTAFLNGSECTIIGACERRIGKSVTGEIHEGFMYECEVEGDEEPWLIAEVNLKLKQEPSKDSSSDEEAFKEFMRRTLMPLPMSVEEV